VVEQVAASDECAHLGIGHAPRQSREPAIGVDEDDPLRPEEAGRTVDPADDIIRRLDLVFLDVDQSEAQGHLGFPPGRPRPNPS
jgi:hypothetical protein